MHFRMFTLNSGAIIWDRYEVRPTRLQIAPYTNSYFRLHETDSKKISLDQPHFGCWTYTNEFRPVWTWAGANFLCENAKSLQINHWCDEQEKHRCWEFMKTGNVAWNIYKIMALVSFRCRVNTFGNFHFGSGLNSCRSYVITPALSTCCVIVRSCWK